MQVEFFEDGAYVAQRVSAQGCDLRLTASGEGQTRDRTPSQIVKRESDDARLPGRGTKCCLEGVRRPWPPAAVEQDERALFLAASSKALSGTPTGMTMRAPVLLCFSLIVVPS